MSNELQIQQKAKTLQALLQASKNQIEMALPKHLTPDRLLRIAMTEARKNPALLDCTQASFIGAIIQTAQLGLEPGGALGHSYLIPFKNRKAGTTEVQFIVGYRGMLELAYRSPKVSKIVARAVYDKDKFSFQYGLDEQLIHIPNPEGEGDKLTHVYVMVEMVDKTRMFAVMPSREIEMARKRSKSPEQGPWETDYEAMALKSCVRKFFKYMPVSIELHLAVGLDEAAERGEQNNSSVIEIVGSAVSDSPGSKTEEFKKALNAEEEPDQGGFDAFTNAGFTNSKIIEDEPEKEPTELIMEVVQAAEAIGLDLAKLTKRCVKDFKKQPRELDTKELCKLLGDLKKEGKK